MSMSNLRKVFSMCWVHLMVHTSVFCRILLAFFRNAICTFPRYINIIIVIIIVTITNIAIIRRLCFGTFILGYKQENSILFTKTPNLIRL